MKVGVFCLVLYVSLASGLELNFSFEEKLPADTRWVELKPGSVENLGDIYSFCNKSGDPLEVDSVVITPDPPKKNANLTVKATAKFEEEVTGGSIAVKLKWGIITVFHKTLDLCATAKQAGLSCPIAEGSQTVSASAQIPSIAPSGHYTGNVEVTDQNGKELTCVNLDFHL